MRDWTNNQITRQFPKAVPAERSFEGRVPAGRYGPQVEGSACAEPWRIRSPCSGGPDAGGMVPRGTLGEMSVARGPSW